MDEGYKTKATKLAKLGFEKFGWNWVETNEIIINVAKNYIDLKQPKNECLIKEIVFTLLEENKS